jgi:hypothetical protein
MNETGRPRLMVDGRGVELVRWAATSKKLGTLIAASIEAPTISATIRAMPGLVLYFHWITPAASIKAGGQVSDLLQMPYCGRLGHSGRKSLSFGLVEEVERIISAVV